MRAMFIPCAASGMAQPRMTSSTCSADNCGTRASAPRMARAARSRGRMVRRFPFGALPMGVRAAATTKASLMISVPQRLAGLKGVGDAFDGLGFTTQAQEGFAFQVHQVLLGNKVQGSQIPAAENIGELRADLLVMLDRKTSCRGRAEL